MIDMIRRMRVLCLLLALSVASGCTHEDPATVVPSPGVSIAQAKEILHQIEEHPKPLERPIVILGGYLDPGMGSSAVASIVRHHVSDDRIVAVNFVFCATFDECRDTVIKAVDAAYPTADAMQTAEVDVIGVSMGGLVGRYAAMPMKNRRRLNVHTLFTISSPHQGALRAAALPPITTLQADMKPGSAFLKRVAAGDSLAHYEIVAYSRTHDSVVGAQYAAPPGHVPIVVTNPPFEPAHVGAATDARIMADILRRLRHEPPVLG